MATDLPSISSCSYNNHLQGLAEENVIVKEEFFKMSHDAIRRAHVDADPSLKIEGIINLSVSYDGTWHKRGHTSNYGLGIVIDVLTGLVIDFHILSKYC